MRVFSRTEPRVACSTFFPHYLLYNFILHILNSFVLHIYNFSVHNFFFFYYYFQPVILLFPDIKICHITVLNKNRIGGDNKFSTCVNVLRLLHRTVRVLCYVCNFLKFNFIKFMSVHLSILY